VLACAFVGLQPYAEEHREYFFGRDRERRIIAANLFAASLSVLYGASGVGKSSILQAGVAADLRRAPRTAVIYFNEWHDDSFLQRLKRQCLDAAGLASRQTETVDPALPLDELLAALQERFRGNILILLDQFEEYFLYHPEEETKHTFDAELARTVNRDDLQVSVLIALRDDWLARLDRFRARIPNLLGNTIRLAHLDTASAEEAIRRPLAVWNDRHPGAGAGIEDPLVEAIIRDVRTGRVSLSESAGLGEARGRGERDEIETAFLQLVLTKLWDAERQAGASVLRLATYERLGGASRIVQAHLNDLLDRLTEDERESCARMFPYLVTPTGSKIAHETGDLVAFAERPREETLSLLGTLSGQRVLRRIVQPERYEIFHDVLAPAILDWRARYVQTKEQAQRRAEERLHAEARSARKLRVLVWIASAFALLALGAAWYAQYLRMSGTVVAEEARKARATAAYLEIQQARNQAAFAALQQRLAEQGRRKAEEQSRIVSSLKDEAEKQAVLAKTNEHVAVVRLVLAAALRSKDSEDPREKRMGILLALGALRASSEATRLEAEDALRQTVPVQAQLPLPLHSKPVQQIVFSPDGRTLATTDGAQIKLWDIPERREILSVESPRTELLFSPDGRYFAAGGPDGVSVRELSGEPRLLLDEKMTPKGGPYRSPLLSGAAIAFRTRGDEIALAHSVPNAETWTLKVWKTATRRLIVDRTDLPGDVLRFAFSDDGNRLATFFLHEDKISVWDVARAQEIWKVEASAVPAVPDEIALNADGTLVAAAAMSGVFIWSVSPSEPASAPLVRVLPPRPATSLSFSPDGKLLTRSEGKDLSEKEDLLWEIPSGKLVRTVGTAGMQASPYGKYRAWITADGVRIVGPETEFTVSGPLKMSSAVFQGDGKLLVTGDADATIRVWDASALRSLREFPTGWPPQLLAISRDGRLVAAATGNGEPRELEIFEWPRPVCNAGPEETKTRILSLAFSPDGARLASGMHQPPGIIFWDTHSRMGKCSPVSQWKQEGNGSGVFGLDFSRDGQRVAVFGQPVAIREEPTGTVRRPIGDPGNVHSGIAWSPDESQVATEDRLWDLTTREPKMTQLEPADSGPIGARRVAFSPDKQFLATPGPGGTVSLWNRSGKRVAKLYGHQAESIFALAFTATGREILVVTDQWKLYRHPVHVEDLVAEARKRVPEPLDPESCARALALPACPDFLLDKAAAHP
jgi:WD40 repeat protein